MAALKRSALALISLAAATGCATYAGTAVDARLEVVRAEPGWIMIEDVPVVLERGNSDCGAAALAMVLEHYGEHATLDEIITDTKSKVGEAMRAGDLRDFARRRGFDAFVLSGQLGDLEKQLQKGRPIIVGLLKPTLKSFVTHYEVVVGYHPQRQLVLTLDPARGLRRNDWEGFQKEWGPSKQLTLLVISKEKPKPLAEQQAR